MTDFIFGTIILSLIAVIVFLFRLYREQSDRLMRALISKDAQEFKQLERDSKPIQKTKDVPEDLVAMSEVDDEEFAKLIKNQIKKSGD